jgi:hypothetical protein
VFNEEPSLAGRILRELKNVTPDGLAISALALRAQVSYVDTMAILQWLVTKGYALTDPRFGWRRRSPYSYYYRLGAVSDKLLATLDPILASRLPLLDCPLDPDVQCTQIDEIARGDIHR